MAKAMNHRALEKSYVSAGWTMDMSGKSAKLYVCPACHHVFTLRRAKVNSIPDPDLMERSARKVRVFRKDGKQPIAACPCGYRRTMVKDASGKLVKKEEPGALWAEEFGAAPPATPKVDDRAGMCTATCKSGKSCSNHAIAGTGKCGIHGGNRLF